MGDVKVLGFTGTREGMTNLQKAAVVKILQQLNTSQVHHGDCIGADTDLHNIARGLGLKITIHPPVKNWLRAFHLPDNLCEILEPKDYLTRNRDIVNACDVLLATPKSDAEEFQLWSGTWATIRYARKVGKPVIIVYPDGKEG